MEKRILILTLPVLKLAPKFLTISSQEEVDPLSMRCQIGHGQLGLAQPFD